MRYQASAITAALILAVAVPVAAQDSETAKRDAKALQRRIDDACGHMSGVQRMDCIDRFKDSDKGGAPAAGGMTAADATLINTTQATGQAKIAAKDFDGAIAVYQAAIDGHPKSPALFRFYTGKASALRGKGVSAYNGGGQPSYPPPGASNEAIRAANAANAALQAQKVAAAVPAIRLALDSAAHAAALADAQKDRSTDAVIGTELREDANLLYRLDHDTVLATPRATIDTEVTWFTRWFDATNPLAESLAAKYGFATAAPLVAKDKAAGVALADKVRARTGADVDGMLGYADVVVAAKLPASDPRRAKALADLTAAEPTVADGAQIAKLKRLKTALAATS